MKHLITLVLIIAILFAFSPRMIQAEGPLPLAAYPRPPHDNGTGIHWAPTLFAQPVDMVDHFLAEVTAMDFKWVKIVQGDTPKLEHEYLIKRLVEQGIMPVLRLYQSMNQPYRYLGEIVTLGVPAGVYYYELYNEPNLSGQAGGWEPGESISIKRIVDLWIPAAEAVSEAGGFPSLPALAPGGDYDDTQFLRDFLVEIKSRNRLRLLDRAWLPLHNYFLNHPVDYPYDEVNLRSVPLSQEEIGARGLTAEQVEQINLARRNAHLPRSQGGYYIGDNIYEDSNSFLKFQAYARIVEQECGFLIPIITTEGGAILGSSEDPRYPPINESDLVQRTLAAFEYMRSQAPPYYFAFMPWLLANRAGNSLEAAWEGAAWYKEDGSTLPIVPALKQRAQATGTASQRLASLAQPALVTATPKPGNRQVFHVPDLAAVMRPSTPADAYYPLPMLDADANPPLKQQEYEVLVVGNEVVELWLLPDLGGRIVRLSDKRAGDDVVPLADHLELRQVQPSAYRLEGGLAWLYPSSKLPLVDSIAWQVDNSIAPSPTAARLTCTEARSHTKLALDVSVAEDGSVSLQMVASNPNPEPRLVELGLMAAANSLQLAWDLPGQTSLPPGGSYTWHLTWRPGTAAQPRPSRAAGQPVALVTPVPAHDATTSVPQPQIPATPEPPVVPTVAVPQADTRRNLKWDERLTDLGITLASRSEARWRLVEAAYEDETQSGGTHNVFIRLLDQNGKPFAPSDDKAWIAWEDGRQILEPKETDLGYLADFPMYGPLGAYSVGVGNDSDTLSGLGLPANRHVNYWLTFQRQF
ncbi:MAG: DUF5107 domain-containing protein [Anaerolineae bacterium]